MLFFLQGQTALDVADEEMLDYMLELRRQSDEMVKNKKKGSFIN